MKIKNRNNGNVFTISSQEWENAFVAKGNHTLYEVIEDDAPLEVAKMKEVIEFKKKQSKVDVQPESNKQND